MSQAETPSSTIADALDQAINHIAGAHGLIDKIRESAVAENEPEALIRELDRVWHSLEISGVLTTQLIRKLEQAS